MILTLSKDYSAWTDSVGNKWEMWPDKPIYVNGKPWDGKPPMPPNIDAAVEAEREACAKLADRRAEYAAGLYQRRSAEAIASDIRARGGKRPNIGQEK